MPYENEFTDLFVESVLITYPKEDELQTLAEKREFRDKIIKDIKEKENFCNGLMIAEETIRRIIKPSSKSTTGLTSF